MCITCTAPEPWKIQTLTASSALCCFISIVLPRTHNSHQLSIHRCVNSLFLAVFKGINYSVKCVFIESLKSHSVPDSLIDTSHVANDFSGFPMFKINWTSRCLKQKNLLELGFSLVAIFRIWSSDMVIEVASVINLARWVFVYQIYSILSYLIYD